MMSVRKKPNGKWFYRKWVKAPGWVKPVRIFGMPDEYGLPNTKASAEEAERRKLRELIDGVKPATAPAPPSQVVTVASFKDAYLDISAANNKPSMHQTKVGQFKRHILPELGDMPLRDINSATFEDFKAALRKQRKVMIDGEWEIVEPLKAKSINNVMSMVRDMLKRALKKGHVQSIPDVEWLKIDEQDFDFLTFAEADDFYDAALAEPEWATMAMVGFRCGLRQGELIGLQWTDIDLEKGPLRVKRTIYRGKSGSPKGGRWRDVDLGDDVLHALNKHRERTKHRKSLYVFCSKDGSRLSEGKCRKPMLRMCARWGVRRIGWHVLRHTFASHLAMLGVPLRHIQKLMGHASITMTERYAHLAPDATRSAVKLLDNGLGTRRAPEKTTSVKSANAARKRVRTVGIAPVAAAFRDNRLADPRRELTR